MDNQPNYKAWRDLGDHIGIQCLDCRRTHWSDNFSTVDPVTETECPNCVEIKDQDIFGTENSLHQDEVTQNLDCEHEYSQKPEPGIPVNEPQ